MKKPKIKSEKETRQAILNLAKRLGCDGDVLKCFNRYDQLLKNCTNKLEYHQIAIMGAAELHKLLDCSGPLVINGEEIIPASPGYKGE